MTYPKKQAEAQGIFQKTGGFVKGNMTLRDYFAAKAMQGDIASFDEHQDPSDVAALIAERAYDIADAMLKAREA